MNRCVEEYMDAVCTHIQCREVHEEIRGELQSHIEEAADVYIQEESCTMEEAMRRAVADMGDPAEVGRRFNSVHRPRMDWYMISLTVLLMMIGLFVMYSLEVAESDWMPALVWGKFVSIVLGLIVLFGLLFFDYRSVARYGVGIFAATTAALILVFWIGIRVRGEYLYNMGPLAINIFPLSPFLFVLGLAGMWSHGDGRWKNTSSLLLLYAIPAVLYVSAPAKAPLVFYTVCFMSMALAVGVERKHLIRFAGVWIIGMATYVTFGLSVYEFARVQAFLHPFVHARGEGYITATAIKTVMNAGLWGHGFGSPLRFLPGTSDSLVLTYMIHAFGWGTGLLFLLLVFMYVRRLLSIAAQSKDLFGCLLTRGYAALLLAQFIWSCAMAVGLAPVGSSILPFVSHGGMLFIAQTLALGFILSVYRRVDLFPASSVQR